MIAFTRLVPSFITLTNIHPAYTENHIAELLQAGLAHYLESTNEIVGVHAGEDVTLANVEDHEEGDIYDSGFKVE